MQELTQHGVKVEFVKEGFTFTPTKTPLWHSFFFQSWVHLRSLSEHSSASASGRALRSPGNAVPTRHGRPAALDAQALPAIQERLAAGASKAQLARELGVSRPTLYNYLRRMRVDA